MRELNQLANVRSRWWATKTWSQWLLNSDHYLYTPFLASHRYRSWYFPRLACGSDRYHLTSSSGSSMHLEIPCWLQTFHHPKKLGISRPTSSKYTHTLPETKIAPEIWWGLRPILRCELLASGRIYVKHMDIPTFKQTNTVGNMYRTSSKIFMTVDFTSLMKSYESPLTLAVFVRSYLQAKPAKPSLATKASLESLWIMQLIPALN